MSPGSSATTRGASVCISLGIVLQQPSISRLFIFPHRGGLCVTKPSSFLPHTLPWLGAVCRGCSSRRHRRQRADHLGRLACRAAGQRWVASVRGVGRLGCGAAAETAVLRRAHAGLRSEPVRWRQEGGGAAEQCSCIPSKSKELKKNSAHFVATEPAITLS
jgi:hypothetical protein